LREEGGFTLPEVTVTMLMMVLVLFALYSIFDMSIRVFSFGNDKVEAAENARLGLEKVERELRSAYPYDKGATTSPDTRVLAVLEGSRITFGNDLNGNRRVDVPREEITYKLNDGCPAPPSVQACSLQRVASYTNPATGTTTYSSQPVAEHVRAGGLSFQYLDRNGNATTMESQVASVRVRLEIQIDRRSLGKRTQILTTGVALRNRVE
jgi:Tfp pilus assembly protein PilW